MKFLAKSEDKRNYLKLKDKEFVKCVFRGDPYDFRTHWVANRSVLCPGSEMCDVCKTGDKPRFRFRVNLIVKESTGYVAKVFEQGWTVYDMMRSLNEDYPFEKYIMKMTRQGEKLNTSYTILPVAGPEGIITPDKDAEFAKVPLNDLGHITEAEQEPADVPPPHTDADMDSPF